MASLTRAMQAYKLGEGRVYPDIMPGSDVRAGRSRLSKSIESLIPGGGER